MEGKYIYEQRIQVRDYEVDGQGIVNNAIYLHYLEITRHGFCEWAGWSFAQMHAQGIDPVLRRVDIEYVHSLTFSEWMVSRLWIERQGARFIFHQDIFRADDDQPVVRALVTIVCTRQGRLTRGDELGERFGKFMEK